MCRNPNPNPDPNPGMVTTCCDQSHNGKHGVIVYDCVSRGMAVWWRSGVVAWWVVCGISASNLLELVRVWAPSK